jgi:hypothetical protein
VVRKRLLLAKKQRQLTLVAKKYLLLKKMHSHNAKYQKEDAVEMPLIVVTLEPKSKLIVKESSVRVESEMPIKIWTEMDLLSKICQVSKHEISKLLKAE